MSNRKEVDVGLGGGRWESYKVGMAVIELFIVGSFQPLSVAVEAAVTALSNLICVVH